jgi:hypothetical protein
VNRRKHKSVTPAYYFANYGPPTLSPSEIRYDPIIESGENALLPPGFVCRREEEKIIES